MLVGGEAQRHLREGLRPAPVRRPVDLPERHVDRNPRSLDEVPGLGDEPVHHALEGGAGAVQRRVDQFAQAVLNMTGEKDRVHSKIPAKSLSRVLLYPPSCPRNRRKANMLNRIAFDIAVKIFGRGRLQAKSPTDDKGHGLGFEFSDIQPLGAAIWPFLSIPPRCPR